MNSYASTLALKYKLPLSFRLSLQLVSIRLRCPRPTALLFEFTAGSTVVASRSSHQLEPNAYETILRESVDMPLCVTYDSRKSRFGAASVEVTVLSSHGGFSKKVGSGVVNIAAMLNAQTLVCREQVKLDKCFDKGALLNVKAVLEFRGAEGSETSQQHSKLHASTMRCAKQPKQASGDAGHVRA